MCMGCVGRGLVVGEGGEGRRREGKGGEGKGRRGMEEKRGEGANGG